EVRRTAVDTLSTLGYRVLDASNRHHALQQFPQHPDIAHVIADGMLARGILCSPPISKLRERRLDSRILMTSGLSESGIMRHSVLDSTIELLQKLYKVEELARRVRALLDGKEESHCVPA